jgi:hypothetical protein
MIVTPPTGNCSVCASITVSWWVWNAPVASRRISEAGTAGRYSVTMLSSGVLFQKISSSSGMPLFGFDAMMSIGCGIRRDSCWPGFGPSIQAMLRCASLSVVEGLASAGIGVSS